jgi:hypothetical protein
MVTLVEVIVTPLSENICAVSAVVAAEIDDGLISIWLIWLSSPLSFHALANDTRLKVRGLAGSDIGVLSEDGQILMRLVGPEKTPPGRPGGQTATLISSRPVLRQAAEHRVDATFRLTRCRGDRRAGEQGNVFHPKLTVTDGWTGRGLPWIARIMQGAKHLLDDRQALLV